MSAFASDQFWLTLPLSAAAITFVALATYVASRIVGRHNVIDVAWGLFFAATAAVLFVASAGFGDDLRRWLLLLMPVVWGLRLAQHVARRSRGKGEDPRYEALLSKAPGNPDLYALGMIYLLQAILAFIISAPIQVGVFEAGSVGIIGWIGVSVWFIGVAFETVGDYQLQVFRRDPANKGRVLDRGLWRYSRHPNYFGDVCVWWGIFLVTAERWPGVLTIFAPVLMTLLLTRGSGARILERHLNSREGWTDYAARTSGFLPLPPGLRRRLSSEQPDAGEPRASREPEATPRATRDNRDGSQGAPRDSDSRARSATKT
jgi:steroid 5-alpha reductase family enzyme